MSKLYIAIAVLMLGAVLTAQDQAPTPRPLFVDTVQKGLQVAQTVRIPPDAPLPGQQLRQLGFVSLLAPDPQRGEVVRVGLPVGALTMRMADAIGNARHARAERKAGERVQRDLDAFLAQQKK